MRNLQSAVNREFRQLTKNERLAGAAPEVRQQLGLLEQLQSEEEAQLEGLGDLLTEATAVRDEARVDALAAQQAHESAARRLEQLQLQSIQSAFPDATSTARYILAQLLAESECIACGHNVPAFRETLEHRINESACPVCGSPTADGVSITLTPRLIAQARLLLDGAVIQRAGSESARADAEASYSNVLAQVSGLTAKTSRRAAEINELISRLPPEERDIHEQRGQLAALNARLEGQKAELGRLRGDFATFIRGVNQDIAVNREKVKSAFDTYAAGFLLEQCELVWQPRRSRVGETGEAIEFPAFELSMSGAGFISPVRRTGPESVSESQREFIDLSFRMALMEVAGTSGASLVVDAPESSLDAVFVTRAADVLSQFAAGADNRLVITSNLIDGNLIPELLRRSGIKSSRAKRVVDLLRIAAPTAATRALHKEYVEVRQRIFERAKVGSRD
jgi:DNA repair exonuclease SbcCD ATPase subunit